MTSPPCYGPLVVRGHMVQGDKAGGPWGSPEPVCWPGAYGPASLA